jgi:two-component system sensor histidine kinase DesK
VRRNLFSVPKKLLIIFINTAKLLQINILFSLNNNEMFTMQIIDNGLGISEKSSSGYGLQNMQKRMKDVGGEVEISSSENGLTLKFVTYV